ncbi:MAG TPA: hypothetical protein PLT54_11630 [Rhodoferax sp.]|nr:hypothetical protein [Rhodoferax sp.]
MTATSTARLDWSLRVYCPECGESNDLSESHHDTEFDIAKRIFTNAWEKLEGWEVECEHCEHEFTIEKVEY